jgi:hypothetical protein
VAAVDVSGELALGVLWGKSNAGGSMHLLLQHLFDAAAVAELMWDRFLAPAVRAPIDDCCDGRGRALFSLVCGLHDVGKASPAFQSKDVFLAASVRGIGLTWTPLDRVQVWPGITRWRVPLSCVDCCRRRVGHRSRSLGCGR